MLRIHDSEELLGATHARLINEPLGEPGSSTAALAARRSTHKPPLLTRQGGGSCRPAWKGDNARRASGAPGPQRCARLKAMSTRKRRDGTQPGFARRLLACLLTALFAVQPSAWASSACSREGPVSGQEICCCSAPSSARETSCCSTEEPSRDASRTSILSPLSRCSCEMRAPVPLPALPRDSSARGADGHGDRCLDRWIESRALASASTPIPEWASPPGEVYGQFIDGLPPSGNPTAAILARGPQGLLDLICVARC